MSLYPGHPGADAQLISRDRHRLTATQRAKPAIAPDHAAARRFFEATTPGLNQAFVTIDLRPDGTVRLVVHRLPAHEMMPHPVCVELAGDRGDELRAAVADLFGTAVALTAPENPGAKTS